MEKYKGCSLKTLKADLQRRGAKVSGRKQELVER